MSIPYPIFNEPVSRLYIGTGSWQTITIPEGARMLFATLVGPGGNGGNGFTRAAGSAGGGGGGGASGTVSSIILPLNIWMPKTLFFMGHTSGGTGSYLSFYPILGTLQYYLCLAGSGGNGGNGTASAVGAAGAAGTQMLISNVAYNRIGNWSTKASQTGAPGGAIAGGVGNAITFGSTSGLFISGGAGGGGTTSADFAGGNISGGVLVPTLSGGLAGSNNGNAGANHLNKQIPFALGGSGGGSSNSGIGGNGGAGGPGCGGGGGGAGTTGGTGGLGGPGFAMISFV
jgi:hypothetical protein